jgi:hypothetical protein
LTIDRTRVPRGGGAHALRLVPGDDDDLGDLSDGRELRKLVVDERRALPRQ